VSQGNFLCHCVIIHKFSVFSITSFFTNLRRIDLPSKLENLFSLWIIVHSDTLLLSKVWNMWNIKKVIVYQTLKRDKGSSWSWSYASWIYNYLCNQCSSPPKSWVRTSFMARCTRNKNMWKSLLSTCDRSVVFSRYSGFLHQ
jgi:hypothetical protein